MANRKPFSHHDRIVGCDTMKGYQYYANHVLSQAAHDPDVDQSNPQEVIEYSSEIAELLVLDEETLETHVRHLTELCF